MITRKNYRKSCLMIGIFVVWFSCMLNAQSEKVDSEYAVVNTKNGPDKYKPLINLTIMLFEANKMDEALKAVKEARELATRYGDSAKIVKALRLEGQALRRIPRTKEVEETL